MIVSPRAALQGVGSAWHHCSCKAQAAASCVCCMRPHAHCSKLLRQLRWSYEAWTRLLQVLGSRLTWTSPLMRPHSPRSGRMRCRHQSRQSCPPGRGPCSQQQQQQTATGHGRRCARGERGSEDCGNVAALSGGRACCQRWRETTQTRFQLCHSACMSPQAHATTLVPINQHLLHCWLAPQLPG